MKKTAIHVGLLGFLTLACSLPMQITFDIPTDPPSDLALTVTAQALIIADADVETSGETPTPIAPAPAAQATETMATNTPVSLITATPSLAVSPTHDITATPNKPMVSVSVDTNCRTGPGQAYDIVGALLVGETTEVTGKNTSSGYWIVKNPDKPTSTCWLWGEYATVAGNQSSLAEISIPPTPTPAIPAAPSNLNETSICYKQNQDVYINDGTLTWQDNSNNEDGFRIYARAVNLQGSVDILNGTVGPNVTSYQFSAGHFGAGQLKVEAFNSAGTSKRVTVPLNVGNCP